METNNKINNNLHRKNNININVTLLLLLIGCIDPGNKYSIAMAGGAIGSSSLGMGSHMRTISMIVLPLDSGINRSMNKLDRCFSPKSSHKKIILRVSQLGTIDMGLGK